MAPPFHSKPRSSSKRRSGAPSKAKPGRTSGGQSGGKSGEKKHTTAHGPRGANPSPTFIPDVLKLVLTHRGDDLWYARAADVHYAGLTFEVAPKPNLNLDVDDKLLCLITPSAAPSCYTATILKKFAPEAPQLLLGTIEHSKSRQRFHPIDRRLKRTYRVGTDPIGVHRNDLVEALVTQEHGPGGGEVAIQRRLGQASNPALISTIVIHQSHIPTRFSLGALEEAEAAVVPDLGQREDLRPLALVTIDGIDARDFDDAVWVEATNEGWHAIVAIADVAHYVRPGGALDEAAFERGNSVYLPDRVVPMLPEALSNGLCSLKPGEDRACLAVHLWVDKKGDLIRHHFVRGLMRSAFRLTYNQVQEVANAPSTEPHLWTILNPMFNLFETLKRCRDERGTLELDLPERKILFNATGTVEDVVQRTRFDSHKLIEELMILANIAAARTLDAKKMPALYRVHAEPSPEKIQILVQVLKTLGIQTALKYTNNPVFFNAILKAVEHHPAHFLVQDMVLRTQSQASYSPHNVGHFGLSLSHYAHFTSPIRRYADLVVHRSLITALGLGEGGWTHAQSVEHLQGVGDHISDAERRAMKAERETLNRYLISFMTHKRGVVFSGRVSGVTPSGLFIELDDNGAQGFLPKTFLPKDTYRLQDNRPCLQGRHHRFTLGDQLMVRLEEANPLSNGMIFSLKKEGRSTPPPIPN